MEASMLYRIAAVLLLFFAVGHTLGFRQSDPKWGVDALLAMTRQLTTENWTSAPFKPGFGLSGAPVHSPATGHWPPATAFRHSLYIPKIQPLGDKWPIQARFWLEWGHSCVRPRSRSQGRCVQFILMCRDSTVRIGTSLWQPDSQRSSFPCIHRDS